MSRDYEGPSMLWTLYLFGFVIFMCIITWFVFGAMPSSQQLNPERNITVNEYSFNGTLGMVTYTHSWFGLGGVESTTISFKNNTGIAEFTFNKDLPVEIGQNYTVNYKVQTIVYYDVDNSKLFSSWYQNRTSVIPENILLSSVCVEGTKKEQETQ